MAPAIGEDSKRVSERFLPGAEIESILNAVTDNGTATSKFDRPKSSVALPANAFGCFFRGASRLPPLPGYEGKLRLRGR